MAAEEQGPVTDPLAFLKNFKDLDQSVDASRLSYVKFLEGKSTSELRWWSKDTVAVVTGGNKGIGFEIVRRLATEGITTILTARDESRGLAAVDKLKAQGLKNVLFHPLDVTSKDSAAKLASWIKEKVGGIDILVGNAGIGSLDLNYEMAKHILGTNYFGQKITVSALLPLLRPSPAGARILFISSECGEIALLKSEKLKQQFSNIDHLSEAELDVLASKYLEDVKAGCQAEEWTTSLVPQYNESKLLLNAYGRLLAKTFSTGPKESKVYVNMMTPGFTSTDINGNHPAGRTVQEGADTAIWILLFPSGGPSGGFFKDRADYPF